MRRTLLISIAATVLSTYSAQALVTISFSAGVIRQADGNSVPLGALGVIVADTTGNGFGTDSSLIGSTLSIGNSLGGSDNLILDIIPATDLGAGIIGFNDTFISSLSEGIALQLYWFPTISNTGFTLSTGVNYGFYRTNATDSASGSSIGFTIPKDGQLESICAFDNITNPGSLATVANLTALNYTAIPEPSSVALVATGGILVAGRMLRRRKNG